MCKTAMGQVHPQESGLLASAGKEGLEQGGKGVVLRVVSAVTFCGPLCLAFRPRGLVTFPPFSPLDLNSRAELGWG